MIIFPLEALEKSSKKRETVIEKEIVEKLQKVCERRKKTGK